MVENVGQIMARFRDGSPEFINRLKITFLLHNIHWTVVVVVLRTACNCLVMSFSQPCIIRGWWISALIRNRSTGHSNNKKFRGYNNIWSFCSVLFPCQVLIFFSRRMLKGRLLGNSFLYSLAYLGFVWLEKIFNTHE